MTALFDAAAREVVELHKGLIALYTGRSRDFSRCEAAFLPNLEMVTTEGQFVSRTQVLQGLKGATARADLDITIHDIHPIREDAQSVLLRYIEVQYRDGETTRRQSIALFETKDSAPLGVAWRYLQESWIVD